MSDERQLYPLERAVVDAWPSDDWRDMHVVLAVSGGPDSVALLSAMQRLKQQVGGRGRLFVGHLNHRLRGEVADADQEWLAGLCQRLDVPLEADRADVAALATAQGDGFEAAARTARYDYLIRIAERVGARWVATGHTQDDQVETVLHRLMRGTGLTGLAGMPRCRPLTPSVSLVRPLLGSRRCDVLAYLAKLGEDYRTDATNRDLRFTRNRLRHELLPKLRTAFDGDFDGAIVRMAAQAAEAQAVIDQYAAAVAAKYVEFDWPAKDEPNDRPVVGQAAPLAAGLKIDCRPLAVEPGIVVREVCRTAWREAGWPLQAMGAEKWQQLADLVTDWRDRKGVNFPGNILASQEDGWLRLCRADALAPK
jgi:tRNA(Ile)-lysidine synthase